MRPFFSLLLSNVFHLSINHFLGGQMLEEGHKRDCGHQDPQEPPQLRKTGSDRGLHPLTAQVPTYLNINQLAK